MPLRWRHRQAPLAFCLTRRPRAVRLKSFDQARPSNGGMNPFGPDAIEFGIEIGNRGTI